MKEAEGPEGEISPQHDKLAMGDVDNPNHSPDERETHSHQGVNRAEHEPPDEDFNKVGHDNLNRSLESWENGMMEYWDNK
jgi:protein required for attachment to host cells